MRRQATKERSKVRPWWAAAAGIGLLIALGAGQPEKPQDQPKPETPAQPPAPAAAATGDEEREAIVTLRDGQRYTGILVSRDAQKVVLKIAGIVTTIKASQVDRVQVLPPINERYKQMRATIDDGDVEGLMRLSRWLQSKAQWDSAITELTHILELQPENPDAIALMKLVESQRDLAQKSGEGKRPPPKKDKADGVAAAFPLLTERDINLIKVYEVNLNDPPRMLIDRDTITALMDQHVGDPLIPSTPEGRDAMYRASPAKILDIMFKIQARNLYERVRVIDQPRSMKLFRDKVHRGWFENSCATARCHGGTGAGRFILATERPGSDATVYTNFLILERYRLANGKPLINYEAPADSAFLQLAMARERSGVKHPVVTGEQGKGDLWRPVFKTEEDARFLDAVEWIKSMYRPRPEYPVQYTLPGPQGVPKEDPAAPPVVR